MLCVRAQRAQHKASSMARLGRKYGRVWKKDFDVLCTKTRYNIVKQKAKVKIDLDPYKPIMKLK